MANPADPNRFEADQEALDPHRRETRASVTDELANKLAQRGVTLSGRESSDEVADILDAVERFERAVEARGGDLMVDQRPGGRPTQPDDRDFVIPERDAGESAADYLERLREATRTVLDHPQRAD